MAVRDSRLPISSSLLINTNGATCRLQFKVMDSLQCEQHLGESGFHVVDAGVGHHVVTYVRHGFQRAQRPDGIAMPDQHLLRSLITGTGICGQIAARFFSPGVMWMV